MSPEVFLFLCRMLEWEKPQITGQLLQQYHPQVIKQAEAYGLVCITGKNESVVTYDSNGRQHTYVIERDSHGSPGYQGPEGWMSVPDVWLRRYELNTERLLSLLQKLLGIKRQRSYLLGSGLWYLGKLHSGRNQRQCLFAANLANRGCCQAIAQRLRTWPQRAEGVLLAVSVPYSGHQVLAGGYTVTQISELIMPDGGQDQTVVESDALKTLGQSILPGAPKRDVTCTGEGQVLAIRGRGEWTFHSWGRRLIIWRLYQAWESGSPWLNIQQLLEEADYKSDSLRDVMKSKGADQNKDWRLYIVTQEGYARLRTPDLMYDKRYRRNLE